MSKRHILLFSPFQSSQDNVIASQYLLEDLPMMIICFFNSNYNDFNSQHMCQKTGVSVIKSKFNCF